MACDTVGEIFVELVLLKDLEREAWLEVNFIEKENENSFSVLNESRVVKDGKEKVLEKMNSSCSKPSGRETQYAIIAFVVFTQPKERKHFICVSDSFTLSLFFRFLCGKE